jgi:hypothetical protein
MSTLLSDVSRQDEVEWRHDPHAFLSALETDSSLFQPARLQERLVALDDLDAEFGGFHAEAFTGATNSPIRDRVKALRARLEAANAELCQSVRSDIVRGVQPHALLRWIQGSASQNGSGSPLAGLGFDCRDELVSGILQFREPSEPDLLRSPEMVPYQPTPVRHILHMIAASALSEHDVFVDLGSGLGHVPLLASMLTGARTVGIEIQPAYVVSAQECAQSLNLSRVQFVPADVRAADLSIGTVFYLYSPFTGSILTDVLKALRMESTRRPIKICSLGPCTCIVANERWLSSIAQPDTRRITVFESC